MCGRYVSPEQAAIERAWHIGRHNNAPFKRRFNTFPTDTIAFLRFAPDSTELELDTGRWGFVPHWWKEAKPPHTSHMARVEEAARKPMWRDAWRRARCLIPAEGWYEWQVVERVDPATGEVKPGKQPHFIHRADGKLFCFAGLMSYSKNPQSGEPLLSCAVLTAAAEGELATIHDRTPVVLPESAHGAWLDRSLIDAEKVKEIAAMRAKPEEFAHWKVRLLVNNTRIDGPELIEPLEASDAK